MCVQYVVKEKSGKIKLKLSGYKNKMDLEEMRCT